MDNLKEYAIRGGFAKLIGQGTGLFIRVGSLAVLARLLSPSDFGIVAMVTVVTSFFDILSSAGLSWAMIQSATITDQQRTKLFWISIAFGAVFGLICVAAAPVLATFYHEPRLLAVTPAFAANFLLSAAGAQHSALLERQLRYVTVTGIEFTAQLVNAAVSILLALAGYGYWALVLAMIAQSFSLTLAYWMATGWVPGWPQRNVPIAPLIKFGATVTLNNFLVFLAYNAEKILIGRFWGASALGVYGRAYQLINIPTASINAALAGVALSSLSRLQDDPQRQRRYFLKGYFLLMSLTVPLTLFCALFGDDIILVVLGPKWVEAAPVFRLLTPTVLIFGIINPLAPLLLSSGLQRRSLHLAMVIMPIVVCAVALGIPYGPTGVAFAFSAAMALWLVPHVIWCLHGTAVSPSDLVVAARKPFLASLLAAGPAFAAHHLLLGLEWPIIRLALSGAALAAVYFGVLLSLLGEWKAYLELLGGFRKLTYSTPLAATSIVRLEADRRPQERLGIRSST
jgi:O-antigen/teichoic acid export membrane protein